ncbi:MAG: hypothetical protein IKQ39_08200 [Oscillospiraceae bacterium]|nr:hypothetical protein [Oscillospiraceae bacterium]
MNLRTSLRIFSAALLLCTCTGCAKNSSGSNATDADHSAAEIDDGAAVPVVPAPADESDERPNDLRAHGAVTGEEAAAAPGEAYLFIADGTYLLSYDGTVDSILSTEAVCVPVSGDGQYTVRVNADTPGSRFAATGDPNAELTASGLSYAAVVIRDAAKTSPDLCITVDAVRVNGKALPLTARSYTFSPDGNDLRANIYSTWDREFPAGAHCPEGPLTGEFGTYNAQIVEPGAFAGWKQVEVAFTVSGTLS